MTNSNATRIVAFLLCTVSLAAHAQSVAAHAQSPRMTPKKYCVALGKEVDRYIASSHGTNHIVEQGYAKAACKGNDPGDGIPILERKLEESKLPLPPHPASIAEHAARGDGPPKAARTL